MPNLSSFSADLKTVNTLNDSCNDFRRSYSAWCGATAVRTGACSCLAQGDLMITDFCGKMQAGDQKIGITLRIEENRGCGMK